MCELKPNILWDVPENFYVDGKLNRNSACREIEFPIFKVPTKNFKEIMKIFKRFCPDLIKFDKSLKYSDSIEFKGIILDPSKFENIPTDLSEKEVKILKQFNCEFKLNNIEFSKINVSYDNYKLATLFNWILPNDNNLTGFTVVGHIVHLNLKEEFYPFKYAIGDLILDKVANVTTVVSKVNKIDTEFRTFELDLLAGRSLFITTIKENGLQFQFDFSKVYWNSRLSTEHCRIVDSLQPGEIVYDACAGVGPFAIPAAKKGCQVIANDLNVESCKWFRSNIELNSKKSCKLNIDLHNLDAAIFIEKIMIPDIIAITNRNETSTKFFLIMNLPSIAVDFLYSIVANNQLDSITRPGVILNVKCYCFIGKGIPREIIEKKVYDQLGNRIESFNLRHVRNVSPSKDMFCAEISVDLSNFDESTLQSKRQKLE